MDEDLACGASMVGVAIPSGAGAAVLAGGFLGFLGGGLCHMLQLFPILAMAIHITEWVIYRLIERITTDYTKAWR